MDDVYRSPPKKKSKNVHIYDANLQSWLLRNYMLDESSRGIECAEIIDRTEQEFPNISRRAIANAIHDTFPGIKRMQPGRTKKVPNPKPRYYKLVPKTIERCVTESSAESGCAQVYSALVDGRVNSLITESDLESDALKLPAELQKKKSRPDTSRTAISQFSVSDDEFSPVHVPSLVNLFKNQCPLLSTSTQCKSPIDLLPEENNRNIDNHDRSCMSFKEKDQESEIAKLKQQLSEQNFEIQNLKHEISNISNSNETQKQRADELDSQIARSAEDLKEKCEEIDNLKKERENLMQKIDHLTRIDIIQKATIVELENEKYKNESKDEYALRKELSVQVKNNEICERENEKLRTKLAAKKIVSPLLPCQYVLRDEIKGETNIRTYLGGGTFGKCYRQTYRGVPVAVKYYRMNSEILPEKQWKSELFNEAGTLANLKAHPGLPQLFGYNIDVSPYLLITQYHGKTSLPMSKVFETKPVEKPDHDKWLDISIQLVEIVKHVHDCQYLHNDIKSNNILLSANPNSPRLQVLLIDFGKACLIRKAKFHSVKPQFRERYMEQYDWIAPEVVDGTTTHTVLSDCYSVGNVFDDIEYHMLVSGKIAKARDYLMEKEFKKRKNLDFVLNFLKS